MTEKHRLTLDFETKIVEEVDELQREMGLPARGEFIRQSILFFCWVFQERKKGAIFLSEKDGKTREIIFPLWPTNKTP